MQATRERGLRITFANARGEAAQAGPFTRLVFEGEELKDGDGRLIAVHRDHQWQIPAGRRYSRLQCDSPCLVWFETPARGDRKSRTAGPFSVLSAVDGVAYGDHRILAFCDSQLNDWHSFDFGQHYPCMVVVPLAG